MTWRQRRAVEEMDPGDTPGMRASIAAARSAELRPGRESPRPAEQVRLPGLSVALRVREEPALYAGAGPSRRIPRTLSIVAPSAGDSVTHQVAPAAP
jgi:hypothetical protein